MVTAEAAVPFRKVLAAQERARSACCSCATCHNHPGPARTSRRRRSSTGRPQPPRIDRFFLADYLDQIRIPAAQISPALAATLLRGTGRTLPREVGAGGGSPRRRRAPTPLGSAQVSLTVDVNRHIVPDRTIVGLIEGSDPKLKDEVVIISAHHDHEGADGAQIFNGADDNVSGTVAVIDIAEAYALAAQAGQRPKRSILFAVFGSEERGPLLGSWAYTERPLRPLDKTVGRAQHGHDRPQHGGAGRRRRALQRARGAERRVEPQQRQHHRPLAAARR